MHPFVGDPIDSGLIVADVGQPGVGVTLNGYDKARTGFDGKVMVPVSVPGTPQRVEINDADLPLSDIAGRTRELVSVRDGSGSVAHFAMRSSASGAIVWLLIDGKPPPIGTSVVDGDDEIPINKQGRAWVTALEKNASLTLLMPDGRRCSVATNFDGHGGPGRIIGPFDCRNPQ
jgi:outer membrane usher protein